MTGVQYIARLSNKLRLSGRTEVLAIRIFNIAKEMKLTNGRGPSGIAAATTYVATILANERRSQKEMAEVANVTEVTIRNRCKEFLRRLLIEVEL